MTDIGPYKSSIKREASQDMGDCEGPPKRPRSGGRAVDVRFLVQSKNAGAIIGKGGSNINRLRTEFSSSVTVPDCPGPERILAIVADIETLGDILLDVLPKLDDYAHHRNMDFDCELRMLLHQSHAGCLIGKGGSRIKELREKTGSQIKIFTNCCPNSTERIVQISGYPNVVVNCVKEICHIISTAPIKGPNKQYDPHHFNPMFCNDYGGYEDSGSKGRGGRGGSFRGGRSSNFNRPPPPAWRDEVVDNFSFGGPDSGSSRSRGGFGGGSGYSGRGGGRGMMNQSQGGGNRWSQGASNSGGNLGGWVTDSGSSYGGGGRMMGSANGQSGYMGQGSAEKSMGPAMGGPRNPMMNSGMGGYQGNAGPGATGPGPANRYMGGAARGQPKQPGGYNASTPNSGEMFTNIPIPNSDGTYSVRMTVSNEVAGAIIGQGGQRIRRIRKDSSAVIKIEEGPEGSKQRIITVTGALNQIQTAQSLLETSIQENRGGNRHR